MYRLPGTWNAYVILMMKSLGKFRLRRPRTRKNNRNGKCPRKTVYDNWGRYNWLRIEYNDGP